MEVVFYKYLVKNKMKKNILGLFVAGTVLASCGGPSPAKDVEGAVKLKQDINTTKEEYCNQRLENQKELDELEREWNDVTKKELLADYGGAEKGVQNLEEKVKKNDEKAIEDWIAYKVAKHEYRNSQKEVMESLRSLIDEYYELDWAYKTSMRLLDLIHSDDKMKADKDKLDADIKIENDKMEEVEKKIKEAYKTWYDGEFKGKKEEFKELNLY